jgi:hypothetical protein
MFGKCRNNVRTDGKQNSRGLLFSSECGDDMFCQNVGWLSTGYIALYYRRQNYSIYMYLLISSLSKYIIQTNSIRFYVKYWPISMHCWNKCAITDKSIGVPSRQSSTFFERETNRIRRQANNRLILSAIYEISDRRQFRLQRHCTDS